MRADRLLQLLLVLRASERATVAELARRLEVSTRTVQRDLEALSLSGVPIYATRGRGGGWSMLPGYRTQLTDMTPGEAATVFVGSTAHVLADLGLGGAGDRAQSKLLAALPAQARRAVDYARQRVFVDHPAWNPAQAEAPAWLDICRRAVWAQRRITIEYAKRARPLELDPLGLVAKGHGWYLVARRTDGEIYSYRLSRIDRIDLNDACFERPDAFDLRAFWAESTRRFRANLPSYVVILRLENPMLDRLPRTQEPPTITPLQLPESPDPPERSGSSEPGWSRVEIDLETLDEAAAFVLGAGGRAEVLSPPELRATIRAAAARVVRRHRGPTPPDPTNRRE